jgi:hypothetical protein
MYIHILHDLSNEEIRDKEPEEREKIHLHVRSVSEGLSFNAIPTSKTSQVVIEKKRRSWSRMFSFSEEVNTATPSHEIKEPDVVYSTEMVIGKKAILFSTKNASPVKKTVLISKEEFESTRFVLSLVFV